MLQYRVIEKHTDNNQIVYALQASDSRIVLWFDCMYYKKKNDAIEQCIACRKLEDKNKPYKIIY